MIKRLTTEQLEAIRKRTEAATEGPWRYDEVYREITDTSEEYIVCRDAETVEEGEFIAHAREDIPALLAEVERLREGMSAVLGAHDFWDDDDSRRATEMGRVARTYLYGGDDE